MARKRSIKQKPKMIKRQISSLAEKTEQILLTMPRIIATQIGKDLVALKQQQNKLKIDVKKAEILKKKCLTQQVLLKKAKTAAARKQLTKNQQALQQTTALITMLTRSIDLVSKQELALTKKRDKYTALQAQLIRFEKEWVKKPSAKKSKIKAKARSSKPKLINNKAAAAVEAMKLARQEPIELTEDSIEQAI